MIKRLALGKGLILESIYAERTKLGEDKIMRVPNFSHNNELTPMIMA